MSAGTAHHQQAEVVVVQGQGHVLRQGLAVQQGGRRPGLNVLGWEIPAPEILVVVLDESVGVHHQHITGRTETLHWT